MAGAGPSRSGGSGPPDENNENWDWGEGGGGGNPQPRIEQVRAHPNLNFYLAPGDVIVSCPYDSSHNILETRLMTHLTKCKRNYAARRLRDPSLPAMIPCRYNWRHHIAEPDYEEHVRLCPDGADAIQDNPDAYGQAAPPAPAVPNPEVVFPAANPIDVTLDEDRQSSVSSASSFASTSASASSISETSTLTSDTASAAAAPEEDWEAGWGDGSNAAGGEFSQRRLLEAQHIYFMPPGLAPAERRRYRLRLIEQYNADQEARQRREQEEKERERREQERRDRLDEEDFD